MDEDSKNYNEHNSEIKLSKNDWQGMSEMVGQIDSLEKSSERNNLSRLHGKISWSTILFGTFSKRCYENENIDRSVYEYDPMVKFSSLCLE